MLRLLRIIGLIIAAYLIGMSAHSIRKMQDAGTWHERYNSRRQSSITLLCVSIGGFGALLVLELMAGRRSLEQRGFRRNPASEQRRNSDFQDTTNIYSAPKTIDAWEGRHSRSSRKGHRSSREPAIKGIWLLAVRLISLVFPLAYLGVLLLIVTNHPLVDTLDHSKSSVILLSGLCIYALLTSAGICMNKVWGLAMGLLLSLGNLIIFPAGTLAGLTFIVFIAFAAPYFLESRPKKPKAASRGMRKAAI